MDSNNAFRYETQKKKIYFTFHRQLFCHCLQLLQEPLTMSEIGKNEKLLVSANKYHYKKMYF